MWLIVHPYTKYELFVKEVVGMPVQNVIHLSPSSGDLINIHEHIMGRNLSNFEIAAIA